MDFAPGDHVEVVNPDYVFGFRLGDTGVVSSVSGDIVRIEDEDGYCSSHYRGELAKRSPA
ncbi:hypothetical protein [Streptomyces sp. NPDC096033]|uniref:hypothetical protein n=1 Tax=Streptomyces sp. NPDC096033 TaxID=3366071 RepID=UPI00380C155B